MASVMLLFQAVPVMEIRSGRDETGASHQETTSVLDNYQLPRYERSPCACKEKRKTNTPELLKKISKTLTGCQDTTERSPVQRPQMLRRRGETRRPQARRQLLFMPDQKNTTSGRQSGPHNTTPDQIDRLGGLTVIDGGCDKWSGVGRDLRSIADTMIETQYADTMIEGQYASVSRAQQVSRSIRWKQDVRGASSIVYSFILMALLKSVCRMFKRT